MDQENKISINHQDLLEKYLKDNGYFGATLFANGTSHFVMSNSLIQHEELLRNAVDGSVGAITALVDYSCDSKYVLNKAIHELIKKYRQLYPDESREIDTSMALLQMVKNKNNQA